jgi:quercetin 2,3-dioxygenase
MAHRGESLPCCRRFGDMMVQRSPHTEIRRADERFATRLAWLDSHHSFSFGNHWDPANTHFGLLLVSNDDVVQAGTGFDTHPHRDMEIVTWVLSGSLVHQDSEGHKGVIYPGLAQKMSAGTGILHSEKNDSWRINSEPPHQDPVHFIQMWVVPDEDGIEPGYEQLDIEERLLLGGLVPVASGMAGHQDEAAIRIKQKDAALYAARMHAQSTVVLPEAPFVHLFVARGNIGLEGAGQLSEGDAVRITGSEGQMVSAEGDAEILVWEMHSAIETSR